MNENTLVTVRNTPELEFDEQLAYAVQASLDAIVQRQDMANRNAPTSSQQTSNQQIQQFQTNQDRREKKRIIYGSIGQIIIYLVITICISVVASANQNEAFDCDIDFGRFLIVEDVYFAFVVVRNMMVVTVLCFAKRPQRVRDISNIVFLTMDIGMIPILSVYGTKSLFAETGTFCRDNGNPTTFKWWVISVCCLIYGWVYSVLLCIGLTSLPLIIIFWCFYRMQMTEISNQMRLEKLPIAGEILKTLSRTRFKNTKQMIDQCVICLEQYRMEDNVSELNCDSRHVFHTKCLEQWLKTAQKSICPLCKLPITIIKPQKSISQSSMPEPQVLLDPNRI